MSKPRFRFKAHVWSCASVKPVAGGVLWRIGYGYTVREAWEEWSKQP